MWTLMYLISALLSALGYYLACAHQRLWPQAWARRRALRGLATVCAALSVLGAIAELGLWAGVFSALSALMLGLVALPFVAAALQPFRRAAHVG